MVTGISPGGRPIDESPLSTSKTSNWVARNGGLPPYVRGIARGIAKKHGGKPTSRDIAAAWTQVKKLAATSKHPAIRAAASKAVAQEKALQARAHAKSVNLSNIGDDDIELDWTKFNQARGKHPRQKKAQPAPGQNTGAIAGYDGPPLNPDVAQKVRQFQQENGLAVNGNLDAATVNYATQYPAKVQAAKEAKKAAAVTKKADNAKKAAAKKVASDAKKAQSAKTKAAKAKVSAAKKAASARAKSIRTSQSTAKKAASAKTAAKKAVVTAQKKKISTQISGLNVEMAKARVAGDKTAQGKLTIQIAELRAASNNL